MYLRNGSALTLTCCHTQIEVADPTFYFTRSRYSDTGPTSPSTDPITPGAWQASHRNANFNVTGMTRPRGKSRRKWDSNPGSSALEADALTTRPTRWPAVDKTAITWRDELTGCLIPVLMQSGRCEYEMMQSCHGASLSMAEDLTPCPGHRSWRYWVNTRGSRSGVILLRLGDSKFDPVSVYCDWVRWKVWPATSTSVWQHAQLSNQIRP